MKGSAAIPKDLMDSLVLSIVSFMNKAGMSPEEIEMSFLAGMKDLTAKLKGRGREGARSSHAIGCDTIAGAVLRSWHRDPLYLDDLANPVPLSMSGKALSLSSLVRAQDPKADIASLVSAMHRTGLIKKLSGQRFLPTTSAATISQMHPFAVDHVVKTVLRLVETVTRNMQLIDSKYPLVERYAHVPDLDPMEAKAFSEFTRQQGAACLEAIEDWLEARRKGRRKTTSSKRVSLSAGMHVFAYLEQPPANGGSSSAKKRQKPTSSRAARA